ncbi:MAG: hypothetical protein O3A53_19830, partial [Acidobacteria bacterium]|nr:hypothetical protein [Acidobacteriota bacterium]
VHAAYSLAARRWRELAATIVCVLPFLAWAIYVAATTSPSAASWLSLPFFGLITRSIDVLPLPVTGSQALVAMLLDYAGIVGVWIALVQSVTLLWPRLRPALVARSQAMGPLEWGVAFFALSAVMVGSPKVWAGSYAFARVLSPWLVFLLLVAIRDRRYWFALPCVLMGLHVAAQAAVHLVGIFRHVLNA